MILLMADDASNRTIGEPVDLQYTGLGCGEPATKSSEWPD